MKKITFKGLTLALMISIFVSCKPKKEEVVTANKEAIKNEIQGIENKMSELYSYNSTDDEEYYAVDAVSFSQNRMALKGKREIRKSIKEDLANFTKGHSITFITDEVFPSIDGNQVLEVGSYKVRDSVNIIKASGNFLSFFEKRDGKYVCIRDMGASELPKIIEKK